MYQVNKSSPHIHIHTYTHIEPVLLARPSVATTRNRLISIRDLDCPADRVSWQSDLLFQRSYARLGRTFRRFRPLVRPRPRYRGHFYLHSLSTASPCPYLPSARPLPFFAWPLADNKMATDRDDEYLSRRVKLSGSRHGTGR